MQENNTTVRPGIRLAGVGDRRRVVADGRLDYHVLVVPRQVDGDDPDAGESAHVIPGIVAVPARLVVDRHRDLHADDTRQVILDARADARVSTELVGNGDDAAGKLVRQLRGGDPV